MQGLACKCFKMSLIIGHFSHVLRGEWSFGCLFKIILFLESRYLWYETDFCKVNVDFMVSLRARKVVLDVLYI